MTALTKRPITTESADICFRIPIAKAHIAKEAIEKILELAQIEYLIFEESDSV